MERDAKCHVSAKDAIDLLVSFYPLSALQDGDVEKKILSFVIPFSSSG